MTALDASLRLQGAAGEREIKVSDFRDRALTTALEDGEVITQSRCRACRTMLAGGTRNTPRSSAILRSRRRIAIVDPLRGVFRVVLGRRADPPALLPRTSLQLAGAMRPTRLAPPSKRICKSSNPARRLDHASRDRVAGPADVTA